MIPELILIGFNLLGLNQWLYNSLMCYFGKYQIIETLGEGTFGK